MIAIAALQERAAGVSDHRAESTYKTESRAKIPGLGDFTSQVVTFLPEHQREAGEDEHNNQRIEGFFTDHLTDPYPDQDTDKDQIGKQMAVDKICDQLLNHSATILPNARPHWENSGLIFSGIRINT